MTYGTVLVIVEEVKIDFLHFLALDTLMRVEHNPKKVCFEMPAFSRSHIISVDFVDLLGTQWITANLLFDKNLTDKGISDITIHR